MRYPYSWLVVTPDSRRSRFWHVKSPINYRDIELTKHSKKLLFHYTAICGSDASRPLTRAPCRRWSWRLGNKLLKWNPSLESNAHCHGRTGDVIEAKDVIKILVEICHWGGAGVSDLTCSLLKGSQVRRHKENIILFVSYARNYFIFIHRNRYILI